MCERELKILLKEKEYDVLAKLCEDIPSETLKNYYYDTDDFFMNRRGITCRIREKNGRFKTTVKNHYADSLNCSIEEDLCMGTELNSNVFEAFGLHLRGELVTSRIIAHKDDLCEVVIDRNMYLGHTDYEIEAEYSDRNEDIALKYLKIIALYLYEKNVISSVETFLARIGQSQSKSARFFEKLHIGNSST